ncbi:MAG: hypothetical protein JWQ16_705 [Novosphingobium sp.]|nr:hypothetical protein [Novosphingobium sp.]
MTPGELADRLAIMDQIYRYCRSVDRLDVALGHTVFHPDAHADFGEVYTGTGRGWIDFICEEHRNFLHHSHQVTNIILELDGDRAGCESYVFAALRSRAEDKVMLHQFWARYIDSWSKRGGHWAIDRRECVIDFASVDEVTPLGEHIRAARGIGDPSYAVLKGQ